MRRGLDVRSSMARASDTDSLVLDRAVLSRCSGLVTGAGAAAGVDAASFSGRTGPRTTTRWAGARGSAPGARSSSGLCHAVDLRAVVVATSGYDALSLEAGDDDRPFPNNSVSCRPGGTLRRGLSTLGTELTDRASCTLCASWRAGSTVNPAGALKSGSMTRWPGRLGGGSTALTADSRSSVSSPRSFWRTRRGSDDRNDDGACAGSVSGNVRERADRLRHTKHSSTRMTRPTPPTMAMSRIIIRSSLSSSPPLVPAPSVADDDEVVVVVVVVVVGAGLVEAAATRAAKPAGAKRRRSQNQSGALARAFKISDTATADCDAWLSM